MAKPRPTLTDLLKFVSTEYKYAYRQKVLASSYSNPRIAGALLESPQLPNAFTWPGPDLATSFGLAVLSHGTHKEARRISALTMVWLSCLADVGRLFLHRRVVEHVSCWAQCAKAACMQMEITVHLKGREQSSFSEKLRRNGPPYSGPAFLLGRRNFRAVAVSSRSKAGKSLWSHRGKRDQSGCGRPCCWCWAVAKESPWGMIRHGNAE